MSQHCDQGCRLIGCHGVTRAEAEMTLMAFEAHGVSRRDYARLAAHIARLKDDEINEMLAQFADDSTDTPYSPPHVRRSA